MKKHSLLMLFALLLTLTGCNALTPPSPEFPNPGAASISICNAETKACAIEGKPLPLPPKQNAKAMSPNAFKRNGKSAATGSMGLFLACKKINIKPI